MPDFTPGSEFAGHRIDAEVKRGGMGVVYRATDLHLDRTVAMKVIAPELARESDFRARFERESRTAAAIDHPNVVPIFQTGEEDGVLFTTMLWVEGDDFGDLIASEGRLSLPLAADIVSQVGAGLDAAHERGLIHRDVKPGNILLRRTDGGYHAYLSDFGLTKRVDGRTALTMSGMFVGTVDYVAPEQLLGGEIDARSDVYSLGCVLFQALAGTAPYRGQSDWMTLKAHESGQIPSVCGYRPDLPSETDELIARALAKAPGDRFPSAGDLGRATVAAANRQPVSEPERSVAQGEAAPSSPDRKTPRPMETVAASPTEAEEPPAPDAARAETRLAGEGDDTPPPPAPPPGRKETDLSKLPPPPMPGQEPPPPPPPPAAPAAPPPAAAAAPSPPPAVAADTGAPQWLGIVGAAIAVVMLLGDILLVSYTINGGDVKVFSSSTPTGSKVFDVLVILSLLVPSVICIFNRSRAALFALFLGCASFVGWNIFAVPLTIGGGLSPRPDAFLGTVLGICAAIIGLLAVRASLAGRAVSNPPSGGPGAAMPAALVAGICAALSLPAILLPFWEFSGVGGIHYNEFAYLGSGFAATFLKGYIIALALAVIGCAIFVLVRRSVVSLVVLAGVATWMFTGAILLPSTIGVPGGGSVPLVGAYVETLLLLGILTAGLMAAQAAGVFSRTAR